MPDANKQFDMVKTSYKQEKSSSFTYLWKTLEIVCMQKAQMIEKSQTPHLQQPMKIMS